MNRWLLIFNLVIYAINFAFALFNLVKMKRHNDD